MAGEPSKPGAGTGAPEAGNGGSGAPATPAAPKPGVSTISLEVIPEEMRGLPENQIKFLMAKMVQGLETSNALNKRLQAEVEEYKKRPAAPGASRPTSVPEEPAKPKRPLKELMEDDPEAALDQYIQDKYGHVLNRIGSVEGRVAEAEFNSIRDQFDDFHEHEDEVRQILSEAGAEMNARNILGAYTMTVGAKALQERKKSNRALANSEPAALPPEEGEKTYAKTQLSEEIRISLGMSEKDYYDEMAADKPLNLKLPGVK